MRALFETTAPRATILVRLLVGGVFLSEGIQKFMLPAELGAGRFAKIGIPWPQVMGPFVGVAETVCGAALILGLATRVAAAIMLFNISVALVSTKLPMLLGRPVGPFALSNLARYGLASMLHEARTDLCMWLGALFLILVGAGRWSADALLGKRGVRVAQEPQV